MTRIKTFINKKIQERDIEFLLFVLFFIFMAGYYFLRVFKHSPWYDELYTYYFFISNGPVYSAIHWPVPNNHIGYSVLSGCVYALTHNPFLSLRGISLIAAIANVLLVFDISRKLFGKNFGITTTCIYVGMWLVNNLSVQGRGYTLSTTMMLIALYSLVYIFFNDEASERFYVLWAIGLCYGLYIVTSSLYWVVPLCVCAGIALLFAKKYKQLIKLIIHSVYAAVATAFLYLTVWLAIGSNLLIKETAEFSGTGHVSLILNHPIRAAKRGIDYMLATPYIQSVPKAGYRNAFGDHWTVLLGQMYSATSIVMIGLFISVLCAGIIILEYILVSKKNNDLSEDDKNTLNKEVFIAIIVLSLVVITPIVVMLQVKLPYYRVFSFYGVSVSLALCFVLYVFFGRIKKSMTFVFPILFATFAIAQLMGADYNGSYGLREEAAYDLMTQNDLTKYSGVAITDCNQEYLYRFVYDIKNENRDIVNSEAVILEKNMLSPDGEDTWEFYYNYETLPLDDIEQREVVYENDYYLLLVR